MRGIMHFGELAERTVLLTCAVAAAAAAAAVAAVAVAVAAF